ncbi:hypothetical protein DFJ58DRAFT_96658 [Suillus subalutaceus]|uniref:uncharacterized protein n=1 Tax=Suillus subalutaceus TaxID=48586 RepID=UPI001B85BF00|nr:uncharacterized protein DFJ58DRAFT_96658 [Suillus subalutaceus]KAG1839987.1 hypothetical protein DFJ58DRAFT_96658 [Suillus subalutaceus]
MLQVCLVAFRLMVLELLYSNRVSLYISMKLKALHHYSSVLVTSVRVLLIRLSQSHPVGCSVVLAFLVTELRRRRGYDRRHVTYDIKVDGLQDLLIITEEKLIQLSPALQACSADINIFVHLSVESL